MIYYAHSKLDYNTDRERNDIKFLQDKFPDHFILDPNSMLGERGAMQPYLDAVSASNMLAVRCLNDNTLFVGKGCFHEVVQAFACGLYMFVLIDTNCLRPIKGIKVENPNDWKRNYAKLYI